KFHSVCATPQIAQVQRMITQHKLRSKLLTLFALF
ncbi:hypothetical protein L195_g042273, partial [Trifolium pratense]